MNINIRIILLFVTLLMNYDRINASEPTEYCNGDTFEPQCAHDEIILMQSAKYGRMKLGKCLHSDLGYLGCSLDVLPQLDQQCSGRISCQILLTERNIKGEGGCMHGLLRYLEASYTCVKGFSIPQQCSATTRIEIPSEDIYMPSDEIHFTSCASNGKELILFANKGQSLNISVINLDGKPLGTDEIYGTIEDPESNQRVVFGDGPRQRHLMTSASNEVRITLQSTSRFLLRFTVFGCPNISPPDGAWMTRNGDIMEVGCHSGAKTWSVQCENNEWTGAVGQCGVSQDGNEIQLNAHDTKQSESSVSINVMVFGLGSMVILISSIIFMTGVCILKSKLKLPPKTGVATLRIGSDYYGNTIASGRRQPQTGSFAMQPPSNIDANYKSLKMPSITPVAGQQASKDVEAMRALPAYSMYMNCGGSDASDSVKYYVLEDNRNVAE